MADFEALSDDFTKLVHEINRDIHQTMTPLLEAYNLTATQLFLLFRLREAGPCNASAIGEMMGVTSGSVTSITDRLVGHGFVSRKHDLKDRRMVIFEVTKEGREALSAIERHYQERMSGLLAMIGEEKAEELVSLLRAMRNVLKEQQSE